ncbi:MAG: HAD-IC family P-type ATPase, partial [Clostridia bacterium]|nr:HAD-IC family P-type ATPase [Clostridia bacterium]
MKKNDLKNFTRKTPSLDLGLTEDEVFARVGSGLNNYVKNRSTKSYFKIFFDNIFTYFNLLGLVCFVALLSVSYSDSGQHLSNYGFVLIFAANIIIGIVQEIRAKITVEKLSLVKAPTATVIRSGEKKVIPVSELVIDDIVLFSEGDQIPADCVLIDGEAEANESLLTGESVPVFKKNGDALLSGSFIVSGSCYALVDKVGSDCYVQTLTIKARKFKKTRSELLDAMNKIIKIVGILIIPLAILTALVQHGVLGNDIPKIVTATTSVIIGMIPSGMFFLTTLALAVGIIKLATKKTLVQDMYSLEMLARVNLICLDKTGTITSGELNVCNTIPLTDGLDVGKIIFSMQNALAAENPTSKALRKAFSCSDPMPALKTIAFSSERKFSAVDFGGSAYALGAPEFVLNNVPDGLREKIDTEIDAGRRVLLLAEIGSIDGDKITGEIRPAALIAMEDVIRPEAIDTIKWFKENDVAVKVISGDDAKTASEIAKKAGVSGAENYVSLFGLSDEEVVAAATKYTVFGRSSPEQKALLLKTLKENDFTVAMTGDGVNDILAMKEADCAVSVASGSSAAKNIAHIVLLSDDFNCMPEVVKEGRRVINNVQQSSSLFLMKTLFTIVFTVISILTWSTYPLTTGMMLPLEFFIIGLPSFFLSLQPNESRVQGRFISFVLSNSVPGAIILVVNTLLAQYAGVFGLDTAGIADSIIVFALVFGGYVCLAFLCLPLNKYRFYLIASV